jgi:hypothetical protein
MALGRFATAYRFARTVIASAKPQPSKIYGIRTSFGTVERHKHNRVRCNPAIPMEKRVKRSYIDGLLLASSSTAYDSTFHRKLLAPNHDQARSMRTPKRNIRVRTIVILSPFLELEVYLGTAVLTVFTEKTDRFGEVFWIRIEAGYERQ